MDDSFLLIFIILYFFFCFYFCIKAKSHCSYTVLNLRKLHFRFSEAREVSQSFEIYGMGGKRENESFEALEKY